MACQHPSFLGQDLPEAERLPSSLDGCAYGLKAPDGLKRNPHGLQAPEGFMKKPWRIRATSSLVWQLQKMCPGDHEHVPCEGGQRTKLSALYPEAMCKRVARVVKCVQEARLRQETLALTATLSMP